jgi:hypothetical protein
MGLSGARDVLSDVWDLSRESDSQEQRTIVSPPTGNLTKHGILNVILVEPFFLHVSAQPYRALFGLPSVVFLVLWEPSAACFQ